MRIGVVGYSHEYFDHDIAYQLLVEAFDQIITDYSATTIEIVSGLTNSGVPKLAYEIAQKHAWITVGISAARALRVKSGVFPCDKQFLYGDEFGDESEQFIAYIDCLIRIGGGKQSHQEVELFKIKQQQTKQDVKKYLIEKELPSQRNRDKSLN